MANLDTGLQIDRMFRANSPMLPTYLERNDLDTQANNVFRRNYVSTIDPEYAKEGATGSAYSVGNNATYILGSKLDESGFSGIGKFFRSTGGSREEFTFLDAMEAGGDVFQFVNPSSKLALIPGENLIKKAFRQAMVSGNSVILEKTKKWNDNLTDAKNRYAKFASVNKGQEMTTPSFYNEIPRGYPYSDKQFFDALSVKQRKEIADKTGWWLGPDNKWRMEISDAKASIKYKSDDYIKQYRYAIEKGRKFGIDSKDIVINKKLEDILDHEELFSVFPEFRGLKVILDPNMDPGLKGSVYNYNTINLNPKYLFQKGSKIEDLTVTLHELQHVLQFEEYFARGGNADEFAKYLGVSQEEAYRYYRMLYGEREAYSVGSRAELNIIREESKKARGAFKKGGGNIPGWDVGDTDVIAGNPDAPFYLQSEIDSINAILLSKNQGVESNLIKKFGKSGDFTTPYGTVIRVNNTNWPSYYGRVFPRIHKSFIEKDPTLRDKLGFDLYKNPSKVEINTLAKKLASQEPDSLPLRYIIAPGGATYIWDASKGIHDDVIKDVFGELAALANRREFYHGYIGYRDEYGYEDMLRRIEEFKKMPEIKERKR